MKTQTNNARAVIAGNHNETLIRDNTQARDLKVKIPVEAKPVTNR